MTRPEAVVCSASSGSTRMRSSSGLIVTVTSNPFQGDMSDMCTGRDVVAVPSRPPALSWHTPKESANQTLALDRYECQQETPGAHLDGVGGAGDQTRSTIAATAPPGVRETTRVALFGPVNR